MTKPDETECQRTPNEMAKRIGALFVLALQSGDHETRHAAAVSADELSWTKDGGPHFTPIERLTKERDDLRAALQFIMAFYEPGQRHLDTEAWKVAEAQARATLQSLNITGEE